MSRKNQRHKKRSGEDKDKRIREGTLETAEHYEGSKKYFAVMKDLVEELHYWKEKAVSCLKFMKNKTSKIKFGKQMVDKIRNRRVRIQGISGHCCCCSLSLCCGSCFLGSWKYWSQEKFKGSDRRAGKIARRTVWKRYISQFSEKQIIRFLNWNK